MTSVNRVMSDVCRWTDYQSMLGSPLPPHLHRCIIISVQSQPLVLDGILWFQNNTINYICLSEML